MIWRGREQPAEEPGAPAQPAEEPGAPGQPEPGRGNDSIGTRVESVLDAAERAAAGIREDAQEWASRYLDESRRKADELASERIKEISTLTDTLISRARAVAQQSDELLSALDDAGRRMMDNSRPARWVPRGSSDAPHPPQPAPSEPSPPAQAPPPPADQGRAPCPPPAPSPPPTQVERPPHERAPAPQPVEPARSSGRVSEGARMLATQMAVAGSTRDEISWRLREEFGIQDASAILDEVGI